MRWRKKEELKEKLSIVCWSNIYEMKEIFSLHKHFTLLFTFSHFSCSLRHKFNFSAKYFHFFSLRDTPHNNCETLHVRTSWNDKLVKQTEMWEENTVQFFILPSTFVLIPLWRLRGNLLRRIHNCCRNERKFVLNNLDFYEANQEEYFSRLIWISRNYDPIKLINNHVGIIIAKISKTRANSFTYPHAQVTLSIPTHNRVLTITRSIFSLTAECFVLREILSREFLLSVSLSLYACSM